MVLNLLDIARSSDDVFAPRPSVVDVPTLVATVQQLMTPLADSLGQTIGVDVPPDLPRLDADPELLRRVLQNLVDNALRHSPRGSPVRIEVRQEGGALRFRVRDLGPGVPPSLRERVFDKYVRLSRAEEHGATFGKGLGLAFCRIAVDAHGGRIWIEDEKPHGSVFTVQIPIAQHAGRAQTASIA
jgi:signal transduction histidine kinase